jgi:polyhydroxyalkanoate synthesis regulator phasin
MAKVKQAREARVAYKGKAGGDMPFAVKDFLGLAQLLEQRPDLRAELRRLVLTEEILSLPEMVRGLAEQIQALSQEVRALAEAQRRTEERLESLTQEVRALTRDVQIMATRVDSLGQDVGFLKGWTLEMRYRERAPAYFQRLARGIHALSTEEFSRLLDRAVGDGKLVEAEADELRESDLVIRGQRREEGGEAFWVIEISWGVGPHDVERAAQRATVLEKLGTPVIPVVAGRVITYEAASLAHWKKVWQVLDGVTVSPAEALAKSAES